MDGLPPLPRSPSPIVLDIEVDPEPPRTLHTYAQRSKPVVAHTPPPKPKGVKPPTPSSGGVELSVFDILNIFRRRWFLSRSHLLTNVISAQKAEDGNISWVEFSSPFHAHLVKCAIALVPHPVPVAKVKKVMFVFVLELLNREGHMAFFELQKGGRKANNAQKEKWRLARKRSRAAKREREREAAKAAQLPQRQQECLTCGRKFQSRKTAKRHKCAKHSKVVRDKGKIAEESSSHPVPPARLNKPVITPAPVAPTAPTHSNAFPTVTGDLLDSAYLHTFVTQNLPTPQHIADLPMDQVYRWIRIIRHFESMMGVGAPELVSERLVILLERVDDKDRSRKRRRR